MIPLGLLGAALIIALICAFVAIVVVGMKVERLGGSGID